MQEGSSQVQHDRPVQVDLAEQPVQAGRSVRRLAPHQARVADDVRALMSDSRRGLVVWHSTGSGKTCTAVAAMEAAWDSGRRIVYVTNVEAAAANGIESFVKCAHDLDMQHWSGSSRIQVRQSFEKRGVEHWTFAKLAHHMQLHRGRQAGSKTQEEAWKHHLVDSLLIIDEAHTLLRPGQGHDKEYAALYDILVRKDGELLHGAKLLLLTATLGDMVPDVLRLLDLVTTSPRPLRWDLEPETHAGFMRDVAGLVTHYDASSDMTRYPRSSEMVHESIMSAGQVAELVAKVTPQPPAFYLAELVDAGEEQTYWKPARAYSNSMFEFPRGRPLADFSSKIADLMETILKHPDEKHFVYSAFHERRGYGGHGAHAVVRALKQFAGFHDFGYGATATGPAVALLGSVEEVKDTVRVFNAPDNDRGAVIQVLVATHRYNEGIDLACVRHIHLLEPLLSTSADIQLKGRAVRMYSHQRLPYPDHWTVTMHRYMCQPPDVSAKISAATDKLLEVEAYAKGMQDELEALKGTTTPGMRARRAFLSEVSADVESLQKKLEAEIKNLSAVARCPHVDALVRKTVKEADQSIVGLLQTLQRLAAAPRPDAAVTTPEAVTTLEADTTLEAVTTPEAATSPEAATIPVAVTSPEAVTIPVAVTSPEAVTIPEADAIPVGAQGVARAP